MNLRDFPNTEKRRKALAEHLNLDLSNIGKFSLDDSIASSRNCENMIGVTQIPLGIAGPLKIKSYPDYFIPLATTEGALVASINRGCKAISESGGATVISKKIGITRVPVFKVKNLTEGQKIINWLEQDFPQIKKIAEATSSHLTLTNLKPWLVGRSLYLRFSFDTQDAMGMNMATIASTEIINYIEQTIKIQCVAISGNMCVDKKPNYLNLIEGRGYTVSAEAILPAQIITSVLKTEKEKILEVAERKLHTASILSGTIGSNAHMANILAAIFLATGQDIAHVAECSTGITTVEPSENGKDLYISVYLPDLIVGTVGGGTQLATQKEALSIISSGEKLTAQQLSERIAAAVLAGEISLLASLAQGTLAKAHKKLGRGIK